MRLSVIIPAHNEEKYIGKTLAKNAPLKLKLLLYATGALTEHSMKRRNLKM